MKKIILLTTIFLTVFSFSFSSGKKESGKKSKSSSASSSEPQWIFDKNVDFPETDFLAQVADGTSKAEAESKALSLLANYFKSTVNAQRKAESSMTESYSSSSGNKPASVEYTSEKKFDNSINIESEMELSGVDYKYYYSEKNNVHYAAAFMNRENTWKMLEVELDTYLSTAKNNFDNAENATDLFTKIRLHAKTKRILDDFYAKYYIARVVDFEKSKKYMEIEEIAAKSEKKVLETKKNASIKLEFRSESAKKLDKKIREVFENEGFIVTTAQAGYHCAVDSESTITQNGEWFVSYPKVSLEVFDYKQTAVFSFAQVAGRIVGVDAKQAETKSTKKLEEMLGLCFQQ